MPLVGECPLRLAFRKALSGPRRGDRGAGSGRLGGEKKDRARGRPRDFRGASPEGDAALLRTLQPRDGGSLGLRAARAGTVAEVRCCSDGLLHAGLKGALTLSYSS